MQMQAHSLVSRDMINHNTCKSILIKSSVINSIAEDEEWRMTECERKGTKTRLKEKKKVTHRVQYITLAPLLWIITLSPSNLISTPKRRQFRITAAIAFLADAKMKMTGTSQERKQRVKRNKEEAIITVGGRKPRVKLNLPASIGLTGEKRVTASAEVIAVGWTNHSHTVKERKNKIHRHHIK